MGFRVSYGAVTDDHATIETPRLILRPVTPDEAARIVAGDLAGWTVGEGWPHADTADGLGGLAAARTGAAWLVLLDGAVIGDCGTVGEVVDGTVEIGYGLAAPYRGRGFGTELVRGLSHWLLGRPEVRRVVAETEADNVPSRRALRAAGFAQRDGRYELDAVPVDPGPPRVIDGTGETLLRFVSYLRERIAAKVDGVSDVDARRSPVPSGTNLLWLLKHSLGVEVFWLHCVFAGDDPDVVLFDDELSGEDTVSNVLAKVAWIDARTAEIVRGQPDLSTPVAVPPPGPPVPTLRWILVHLVEEYGRHAGHADILRELLDGRVGR